MAYEKTYNQSGHLNPYTNKYQSEPYVDGAVAELTVNGSGFGSGPNIALFDNFIGSDGDSAFGVSLIGQWDNIDSYGTGVPKLHYDSTTNRTWFAIRDTSYIATSEWRIACLFKYFGPVSEFRLSHRAWVPVDKNFPSAATPATYPAQSSWKMTWLSTANGARNTLATPTGVPNRNVCLPSHIGSGTIAIAGNDNEPKWDNGGSPALFYASYSHTAPTLYSWYQANGGASNAYDKTCEFLVANDIAVSRNVKTNADPFNGTDASFLTRSYDAIRFPGWFENNAPTLPNTLPLSNDFYMAIGENSRAMIMVTNAATLAASTAGVHQCAQTTWTGTQIKFRLYAHQDFGVNNHVHIILGDGTLLEDVTFSRSNL